MRAAAPGRWRAAMRRLCRLTAVPLATLLALPTVQAQEEVPFISTPDHVTKAMLELAKVGSGDRVVDLGSGDGRIVITAARMGATGLGVEIVPDLVAKSRDNARRAGVAGRVEFRQQDLFETPLDGATVVTMYLLPELNLKLRPRLLALPAGTRIVSHDWDMGDWQPDHTITLDVPDKGVGREKVSRVHLWVVPARVQGLWCGPATSLRIEQRFQRWSATFAALAGRGASPSVNAPLLVQDGAIDADGVTLRPAGVLPGVVLRANGDVLHVESVPVASDLAPGSNFTRAGHEGASSASACATPRARASDR